MPPISKLLGWRLIDLKPEEGVIKIGFEGRPEFCNPTGFIQGGILSAMLDDTMGPAAFIMSGGKLYTPTITMTVNFISPGKVGAFECEAKVVQMGKTVVFVEAKLMDDAARWWRRRHRRRGWWRRQGDQVTPSSASLRAKRSNPARANAQTKKRWISQRAPVFIWRAWPAHSWRSRRVPPGSI